MKKTRKAAYVVVYVVSVILTLGATLSIFRDTESRYLKMLDFPRIQFFIASLLALVLLVLLTRRWKWYDYIGILGLSFGIAVNGSYLIHYSGLVAKTVPTAYTIDSGEDRLSLFMVNVKMSNRNAEPLINLIRDKKPDLVLAMEVNSWWDEKLNVIEKEYPYAQETINELAYGMTLYSRFPLEEIAVEYLHNKNVPSFHSTITMASGRRIGFHSVHPVPPTHFEHLPDNAGKREAALIKVGRLVKDRNLPTIIAGDLNDVVWSHVDKLTGTDDLLFDVRTGRGIFSSYNAENFLMRWPLDHVFVTKEFRLATLERLSGIGSDHFPMYVVLVL